MNISLRKAEKTRRADAATLAFAIMLGDGVYTSGSCKGVFNDGNQRLWIGLAELMLLLFSGQFLGLVPGERDPLLIKSAAGAR